MNNFFLERRSIFTVKVLISGLFLGIYLSASVSLLMSNRLRGAGHHENDLYFQADSEFFAKRVAKDRHGYDRIRYHPMFVIYFNHIGRGINKLTDNPEVTACIINSLAGSIGIFLALTLFYDVLEYPALRAVLYTIILGLTSTHVVFSIVPDTFIFTSVGLIGLLIIALRHRSLASWIGITVYSIGITITNAVPAFLAAYFFLLRKESLFKIKKRLFFRYLLGVLSVSAILSVAQKVLHHVWLFTEWKKFHKEDINWYLYMPTDWSENWERLGLLMKHVLLFCIAPPHLKTTTHFLNSDITMATFMETAWWDFPIASWPAVLFWVALLGLGTYYLIRLRLYQYPLMQLMILGLAFNIGLHYLYGDDFMLFSCDWLIFLLLIVFFSLEKSPLVRNYTSLYQIGLSVFALSLLAASGWLVYDMYHILLIQ